MVTRMSGWDNWAWNRGVDRDPVAGRDHTKRACRRLAQHPGIKGEAQAAGINDRDELARGQEPALGVTPAHQCLDAGAAIDRKIELWLIVEFELVAFERAAYLPLELLVPLHFGIEFPVVEPSLPTALVLCPIEGAISTAISWSGSLLPSGKRATPTLIPIWTSPSPTRNGSAMSLMSRCARSAALSRACHIERNDGKLVAAEACEGVAFTNGRS